MQNSGAWSIPTKLSHQRTQPLSWDIDVLVKGIEEAVSTTQQFLHYWHDDISDFASSDSASSIAQIVPDNRRRAYDMRKVIAAFADKDSVLEVGSAWGESLVTALHASRKICWYLRQPTTLTSRWRHRQRRRRQSKQIRRVVRRVRLPLISFVDNPGYMVGPEAGAKASLVIMRVLCQLFTTGQYPCTQFS